MNKKLLLTNAFLVAFGYIHAAPATTINIKQIVNDDLRTFLPSRYEKESVKDKVTQFIIQTQNAIYNQYKDNIHITPDVIKQAARAQLFSFLIKDTESILHKKFNKNEEYSQLFINNIITSIGNTIKTNLRNEEPLIDLFKAISNLRFIR